MSRTISYEEEFEYNDIRVRVECPLCQRQVNFWMHDERTQKTCPICSKVTFVFISSIPKKGILRVEVHCEFNDTSETQIDPLSVKIIKDYDVPG